MRGSHKVYTWNGLNPGGYRPRGEVPKESEKKMLYAKIKNLKEKLGDKYAAAYGTAKGKLDHSKILADLKAANEAARPAAKAVTKEILAECRAKATETFAELALARIAEKTVVKKNESPDPKPPKKKG